MTPRSVRKSAEKWHQRKRRIGLVIPSALISLFLMNGWVGARSEVALLVDGQRSRRKTTAETIGEFLSQSSIKLRKEDLISPHPSSLISSGTRIVVRRAFPVTVRIEGQERKILTAARTVSEMLVSGNIKVEAGDRLDTPLHSAVTPGTVVNISKQVVREETVSQPVPFPVIKQRDDNLEIGKTVVDRPGKPGLIERVFRVTLLGGQEIARELKMESVRAKPLARIVRIGALRPIIPMRGQDVSERPLPPPAQPLSNSQEGVASFYTLGGKGIGMTAAHRSLPYGTKVRVINLANGKQVEVVINDRGPFSRGRIIDLATDAFRAIASTSQGLCRVRIEW